MTTQDEVRVFEYESHTYQLRRIDVFSQLALTAKLSVVLATMAAQPDTQLLQEQFPKFFTAFAASMPQTDIDEVFRLSLSSVFRRNKNTWSPIYKNGQLLYQDITLKETLTLLWAFMETNGLNSFFVIPASDQAGNPSGAQN